MRKAIIVSAAAGLIGFGVIAAPVAAFADQGPASTTTTFHINEGSLAISIPASADLGGANMGATSVSGSLGPVSVTDNRGLEAGSWAVSVTSTDFTTGGSGPADTIAASHVTYDPGSVTGSGNGNFSGTPGTLDNTNALVAVTADSESGSAVASWDPTITVALPSALVATAYSAQITQSVG